MISDQERVPTITQHPAFVRTYPSTVIHCDRPVEGPLLMCGNCTPLPGDEVELASSGRKYVLHRTDCRRASWRMKLGKRARVEWEDTGTLVFPVRMKVKMFPTKDAHQAVLRLVSTRHGRVLSSHMSPVREEGVEGMEFLMELPDREALEALSDDLLKQKDIIVATRI